MFSLLLFAFQLILMLLMVEKRVGICHTVHKYATANNKYVKEYNIR